MRGISIAASVLALTAIFSLSFGVTRYAPLLASAMDAYASLSNFIVGALIENLADWLARACMAWFSLGLSIGDHWRDIFALITLYIFADASQFVGRWVSPDPGTQRWSEFKMALTALGAGFILALMAAVVGGLAPLDGSRVAGLALFVPAVVAFGLYAVILAWAHAAWNRENYRLFSGKDETRQGAFSWRARAGLARAGAGLVAGLVFYGVARILDAASPGLLTLALLAFTLGGFWIRRAANRPGPKASWRERMTSLRQDHNGQMGFDMILKVLSGFLLAGMNANLI
jgi:hypothetical protein